MTLKEMNMIRKALCKTHKAKCPNCLLGGCLNCTNVDALSDFITPTKEKELMNWYHDNVNTYLNDFCKKFPKANREFVVNNICCSEIYGGMCECHKDGCVGHWNSLMENE